MPAGFAGSPNQLDARAVSMGDGAPGGGCLGGLRQGGLDRDLAADQRYRANPAHRGLGSEPRPADNLSGSGVILSARRQH